MNAEEREAAPGPANHARGAATCLATVTTEPFLPGTLVALQSFANSHRNFAGDVVVIYDELSALARGLLRAICPRVRLVPVSSALRQRIAAFGSARPEFGDSLARFFALDVFLLSGYRKVLYCDSDVLFRQSIDELFGRREALICCGDAPQLLGKYRSAESFLPIDPADGADALRETFNDGLLLVDAALLGADRHADLLAMLVPEAWPAGTSHTKQLLQNRHFAGRQTLVSSTYNFLLASAAAITRREGITAAEAKVLHFNLPAKPWMPAAALRQTLTTAPSTAWSFWYQAWLECLSALHLRASDFERA